MRPSPVTSATGQRCRELSFIPSSLRGADSARGPVTGPQNVPAVVTNSGADQVMPSLVENATQGVSKSGVAPQC